MDHLEQWLRAYYMDILDESVCRAVFHLLHQRTVRIPHRERGGRVAPVTISYGDQYNSSILAKLLAEKTGVPFLETNVIVAKLIAEGKYPLLEKEFFIGEAGWIIVNPWKTEEDVPDALESLIPLFMSQQHIDNREHWKRNAMGYTLVPNPEKDWRNPPKQFFFPNPLPSEKDRTVENPSKPHHEWVRYDTEERKVREEAEAIVINGEGIDAGIFVGCAKPIDGVMDKANVIMAKNIIDQQSNIPT